MLKDLAKLQDKLDQQGTRRHQRAEQAYRRALSALAEAVDQGFSRRDLALQASKDLIEAIRHHRQDPRPYVAMAYLMLIFDDTPQAQGYLRAALEIDSTLPDALSLKRLIERAPDQRARPGEGVQLPDSDQSYEALQRYGMSYLQELMRSDLSQSAPEPQRAGELAAKAEQIETSAAEFARQIQGLEADYEVSALLQTHNLMTKMARRYREQATLSQRFAEIGEQIDTLIRSIRARKTPRSDQANTHLLEQQLEAWLDQCDAIADRLDECESRGHSIASLHAPYRELLQVLEAFREALDEL